MKIFKIVATLSLVLFSNLVSAHAGLKSSNPMDGAMLNKLPTDLMLEFTTPVKLVKLQLTEQSGKVIKLKSKPSKQFENTFNLVIPTLNTGNYKVKWMAMGKDAHKMKGDFTFMVHSSDMNKMAGSSDGHSHKHD